MPAAGRAPERYGKRILIVSDVRAGRLLHEHGVDYGDGKIGQIEAGGSADSGDNRCHRIRTGL